MATVLKGLFNAFGDRTHRGGAFPPWGNSSYTVLDLAVSAHHTDPQAFSSLEVGIHSQHVVVDGLGPSP